MTKTLSYQHASNAIKLLYEREALSAYLSPEGHKVYEEFSRDVSESKYGALYAFVDEQIALLRKASFFFGAAIVAADSNGLVYYRLCIKQMQTLTSIRMLSSCGLDLDARALLRLLYETSLLWIRFRVDPAAIEDFKKSSGALESNAFWHKYLAKEKSEKFLTSYFVDNGITWLGAMDDIMANLKHNLGRSAHPSHIASASAAENDWLGAISGGVLGTTSNAAHFTLAQAIFVAAFPFSVKPEPSYALLSHDLSIGLGLGDLPVSWETYNADLRDMMAKLFLISIPFSNGLRNGLLNEESRNS